MFKIIGCSMLGLTSFAFSGCRDAYTGGGADDENKVGTMQLITGVAEMAGGAVLTGFGIVEMGETIVLGGGGSFGVAVGIGMVGIGAFGLLDGYMRSSVNLYNLENTFDLAKGMAEVTGGAFLAFNGAQSAFEVYNGNQFSYFELGMAVGGLGGGGYLLWDGYKRVSKELTITTRTIKEEHIKKNEDDNQKAVPGSVKAYNEKMRKAHMTDKYVPAPDPIDPISALTGEPLTTSEYIEQVQYTTATDVFKHGMFSGVADQIPRPASMAPASNPPKTTTIQSQERALEEQKKQKKIEESVKKGQQLMGNLFSLTSKSGGEKSIRGIAALGVKK